jgi:hypothetical protein
MGWRRRASTLPKASPRANLAHPYSPGQLRGPICRGRRINLQHWFESGINAHGAGTTAPVSSAARYSLTRASTRTGRRKWVRSMERQERHGPRRATIRPAGEDAYGARPPRSRASYKCAAVSCARITQARSNSHSRNSQCRPSMRRHSMSSRGWRHLVICDTYSSRVKCRPRAATPSSLAGRLCCRPASRRIEVARCLSLSRVT